jgi:hypothetical protein
MDRLGSVIVRWIVCACLCACTLGGQASSANCNTAPARVIAPAFGAASGQDPFWFVLGSEVPPRLPVVLATQLPAPPDARYVQKLLLVAASNLSGPVTVELTHMGSGGTALAQVGSNPPLRSFMLNPAMQPTSLRSSANFADFPATIFVSGAGCIKFTVVSERGKFENYLLVVQE